MMTSYLKSRSFRFLTCSLLGCAVIGINVPSVAQVFWQKMVSVSGLFETEMRVEGESRSDSLLMGNDRAAYSEEISAVIDHRPYKNVLRTYSVRLDQTFGPSLPSSEKALLAEQEADRLLAPYKKYDSVLKYRFDTHRNTDKGQSFFLIYNDPDFGVQGIKVNLIFTDVAKITQTIIGPADTMEDGQNTEFLKSLAYDEGLPVVTRKIPAEWPMKDSPHNIFSVRLPPKTYAYFETEPDIQKQDTAEMMRFVLKDPVRDQNLFYNTYGYFFNQTLDFATVEKFLGDSHIRKHRRDPSKVGISKGIDGEIPYIEAMYEIPPTKKFPYLNEVKLRAYFSANHIFVQEIMGSKTLVNSAFVWYLMREYQFHPEKSDLKPAPAPAGAAPFNPSSAVVLDAPPMNPPSSATAP